MPAVMSKATVKAAAKAYLPPLTGVPKAQVGEETQSFIDSGVNNIQITAEPGGTFTVAPQ